jgi:hypothetical protein
VYGPTDPLPDPPHKGEGDTPSPTLPTRGREILRAQDNFRQ